MVSFPTLVEVAAELRNRAGQTVPAFSTRQIVEASFPDTLVTGRVLPDGIREVVSRSPEGPVILYARGLSTGMQRFAIAHALAHLLFDDHRSFCEPGRPGVASVEKRADHFAAELLVPLAELRPHVHCWPSRDETEQEIYLDMVDEISSHFGVVAEVIDRRIRELRSLGKEA